MTATPKKGAHAPDSLKPSTLPFDPADLVAMRVLPAQYSRMVGVSKQCVSGWIKRGIVNLGPDGKLDPAVASRQVIERTDPTKLRARVFRQATASHAELHARIRALEQELTEEREWAEQRAAAAGFRADEAAAQGLERVLIALAARFADACQAHAIGDLPAWLDELAAVEFYGQNLADYRAMMAEEMPA